MNSVVTFGITVRHMELVSSFFAEMFELRKNGTVKIFQEQNSLVYFGDKKIVTDVKLVNVEELDNLDRFIENTFEYLHYVQPDFMMFNSNIYYLNKNMTKIAGVPNLIVEVWSENNTEYDIYFKKHLYSTGGYEHWYIFQDSNIVECWIGSKKINNQNLTDILVTESGLKFDLRYLAL